MSTQLVKSDGDRLPEVLKPEELSFEAKQKVEEIAAKIDISDSQAILLYGIEAQNRISDFSDMVLNEVKAKDSGYVGEVLTSLMVKIKDTNVDSLFTGGGLLSKIPLLGALTATVKKIPAFSTLANAVRKLSEKYQTIGNEIERIVGELDRAKVQLLRDVTMLDSLYGKNLDYMKQLDYFILAGASKIIEIKERVLPDLTAGAQISGDAAAAQRVNDMEQMLNRFEKKVHDLKLSRMICIQTAPQIRLIQNNDQMLVEKIQSSILNTIPLWKNQIVLAITIFRQKKALEVQKKVTDTTNELLAKNSEMLKENTIGIAKEAERGIVEIETLRKVNNDLITTIEETLKIQQEGRIKRHQAEIELIEIEKELKQKLMNVSA